MVGARRGTVQSQRRNKLRGGGGGGTPPPRGWGRGGGGGGGAPPGGIAIINSIGNLSGFAGPFVMGKMKDATGSYTVGLLAVAGTVFLAMLVALSLPHEAELEQVEEAREPERLRAAAE